MAGLILGPMARWASDSEATVWVETDAACAVTVAPPALESAPLPLLDRRGPN